MTSHSTHLTPDMARELLRRKPDLWEGRGFKEGDMMIVAEFGECRAIDDSCCGEIKFLGKETDEMLIVETADCLLLASETDLMDALERVTADRDVLVTAWSLDSFSDSVGQRNTMRVYGFGAFVTNTRLEALYAALMAVCEATNKSKEDENN